MKKAFYEYLFISDFPLHVDGCSLRYRSYRLMI